MEHARRARPALRKAVRAAVWLALALSSPGCAREHRSGPLLPAIGSIVVLGLGASHGEEVGEPCLPSRSKLDDVLRSRAAGKRATERHVADDAIPLAPRLRVRILARAEHDRDVRLRLLDGAWAGASCWVDGELEDLFAPD